jgi:hypothetical protein
MVSVQARRDLRRRCVGSPGVIATGISVFNDTCQPPGPRRALGVEERVLKLFST